MKTAMTKHFISLATAFLYVTTSYTDNPIVQTIFTADPAPMVHNDTCYLYTTHDEDVTVNDFYTMNDWRCFSSTDMVNWTHHGSPLSYKTFSWSKGDAWAAQCIFRNGKFYMYVPVTQKSGGAAIGVAVATSPTGPFTDPLGKKLVAYGNGYDIDPTVFIDDNGQAYLYWGNGTLWYVKLQEDMVSYSGNIVTISPKPSNFTEGPWYYKRDSMYYMVYSTTPSPNEAIAYSTSSNPTGPWTSKGTIMSAGNCYTNHAGVVDYKGNSYIFYHNNTLSKSGSFTRSVCLEQFEYTENGTIPTIKMTTAGPSQIGHLNPYDTVQAETICWESGVETGICSEGGFEVDSIHNGDYIKVKGVNFTEGAKSFTARVASKAGGSTIELRLDSLTGTLIGSCTVGATDGLDKWAAVSCNISGATGVHDLFLKFTGSKNGTLFNFNWWMFTRIETGVSDASVIKNSDRLDLSIVSADALSLHLDASQQNLQKDINVCLFDLTGRLAATLFSGRLPSSNIIIPFNNRKLQNGLYLARVSQNGTTILTKSVTLY
jgi:GH43 family beta-xylosidase